MPTTHPPLLLALLSLACVASGQPLSEGVLTPSFDHVRPGSTFSAGPQGLPRHRDPEVQPAAFKQYGEAKPIPQSQPAPEPPTPLQPRAARDAEPIKPAPPQEPAPAPGQPGRRLIGSSPTDEGSPKPSTGLSENPLQALAAWRPSSRTLMATGGGLAIAIGLVFSLTWLLRSLAPKSSRPLPKEVVEVLGRAPLGAKQTTQLVRVGGKLLLVAITPEGTETLTEITDPGEVARLIAACESHSGRGQKAEFDAMLREMADQRTTPGFLGEDPRDRGVSGLSDSAFDPRSLAAAYANTPGGRGDA